MSILKFLERETVEVHPMATPAAKQKEVAKILHRMEKAREKALAENKTPDEVNQAIRNAVGPVRMGGIRLIPARV